MSLIIALLVRFGLSQRVAGRVAPFAAAALAFALLTALAGLWLHFHDKGVVERHDQAREVQAGAARETAAAERVADAVANATSEKELHDAIREAHDDGAPSPAARALACERLRRIGRIPPACRPAGGDGSEASPD